MLVSIVIPAFGRQNTLQVAVDSAANQAGLPSGATEIIVVDDASPSPIIVPTDHDNVRSIRLTRNAGAGGARNAGVEASKGDYIAFLDSDDAWLPDQLHHQLDLARKLAATHDPSRIALASGFYMPDRHDGVLERRSPVAASKRGDFVSGCWMCPGSTFFAHRSVFGLAGGFDTRFRRLEDYEWMLRFANRGGQLFVSPYAGAVIAPSSHPKLGPIENAVRLIREMIADGGTVELTARERRELQSYLELELTAASLGEGKKPKAAYHLAKSLLLKPRLTGSVRNFWKRDKSVPDDAMALYRRLVELAAA